MKQNILVISPGVLPLPPILGGAVENLITRLHPAVAGLFDMEYISVYPPAHQLQDATGLDGGRLHYIHSINPLADFTFENQFELHESKHWQGYRDFCVQVARERTPCIIHVHNEAHLLPHLRRALPTAQLLLHVNDEVVTRMGASDLAELARSCDLIWACSQHIQREIHLAFRGANMVSPPLEVFYNCVDLKEYDPAATSSIQTRQLREKMALGDGPIVLFVGRMIEQKGPHLALRAFRRIAETHPDAQFVFVGAPWYSRTNESPFVASMREEAAPIADRIRFTGYVNHRDMPLYYNLANIVCVPSIWDDPSPFVAYEAQAMGKPVVASTRGGIPEIVEDRVTGRCIDVFNTNLFAQILSDWLRDSETAHEIGKRGRQRIAERFNLTRSGHQLVATYQRLAT